MLVQQLNVSQMWGYETNHTHFLHKLHELKLRLTIPASHRISTFFLFLVTTFWPRVSSSSLMSVCVWKHGRPWERRDQKSRHLRCHASAVLKRACWSLYRQALKMRLKSLGTCYVSDKQIDGKKTRCDTLWCSLALSAGSIHHLEPSRSIDVIDISENNKFLKHCRSVAWMPIVTGRSKKKKSVDCRS